MSVNSDSEKQYIKELVSLSRKKYVAVGYQKLTVAGTAVSLTVPTGSTYAVIIVESSITTAAIRYLELGASSLPTATDGLPKISLDEIHIDGYQNLINFRAIQVGAGTHTLHIQYYT